MANVLREKLGPLETWQYLAAITGLGLAWYAYTARQKAKQAQTSAASQQQTTTSTSGPSQSAANVPQFVIQNQFPPSQPAMAPPPSNQVQFVKFTADGNTSLQDYAKQYNTQPSQIWWATQSHEQTPQELNDYENSGSFNTPVPKGLDLYYPVPG